MEVVLVELVVVEVEVELVLDVLVDVVEVVDVVLVLELNVKFAISCANPNKSDILLIFVNYHSCSTLSTPSVERQIILYRKCKYSMFLYHHSLFDAC